MSELHDMMHRLIARDDQEAVRRLDKLLESGMDPNELDELGLTPLGLFAHQTVAGHFRLDTAVLLLLKHGADPMRHDHALRGLIQNNVMVSSCISVFLKGMVDQEIKTGIPYRAETGQNPLHMLACERSDLLDMVLDNLTRGVTAEKLAVAQQWCQQVDDRGDNPLHTLWKNYEVESKQGVINGCWLGQSALIDQGTAYNQPNLEGMSAMDLCLKLIEHGMSITPTRHSDLFQTELERRQIERDTPAVKMASTPKSRL